MTLSSKMKFGVFMAPFHRVGENPTLALERDLELLQWLDVLAQNIARDHGGEIRVESTLGEGALFTVSLPSTPPQLNMPYSVPSTICT